MSINKKTAMVSACLLGINCRYDGKTKLNTHIFKFLEDYNIVPFCPEQLGGLPTPRLESTKLNNNKLINKNNKDVTDQFLRGAKESLKIAEIVIPDIVIFKEGSPSCGLNTTNINWKREQGSGITASLFKNSNIKLLSDELF